MRVDRFVDAYLSRNFCNMVAGSLMYAETALRGAETINYDDCHTTLF
jgi:hypothetical protein